MVKCQICRKRNAKHECEICGKLFCDECGDYFYPDEAWYCYRCLTKIEHEEDEQLIEPEVEQG